MSRTQPNQTGPKNPARKFLEWKSSKKAWVYYDKTKEAEVEIPHAELAFIVLDQLNTVKGFDERAHSGIWSNEVRNVKEDKLTVRNKKGVLDEGTWDAVKSISGAKFTKSVYVMAKINGDYELANLQLNGAALGAWFDFTDREGSLEGDIVISAKRTKEGKKGAVTYFMPDFEIVSKTLSKEAHEQADEMDQELQGYLLQYLNPAAPTPQAATAPATSYTEPHTGAPIDEPDGDFETEDDTNIPF